MNKIRISCQKSTFNFSICPDNRDKNNVNLTQTNIINTDSMIFTKNYILKNIEVVASFITSLSIQRNIHKVNIKEKELTYLVLLLIQNIKVIDEITLTGNEELDYESYERLLFSPYIKTVNCYNMKPFMIEQLDKKGKNINLRSEIFFVSNFMSENNLDNYSSIYYKKVIDIKHNFDEKDFQDFEIFCKVNNKLKAINMYFFSKENIRQIVNILARNKKVNIKININQDEKNEKLILSSIDYLRYIQDKVKDNYKYKLNIVYPKEYKQKNILNELTINNIKVCCLIIIIMVVFGIFVIESNNIRAIQSSKDLNSLINTEIKNIQDNYSSITNSNIDPYIQAYKEIFKTLKEKNADTVGYLRINNTKVDYPVVKADDNKFYLVNDFNKKRNTFGWIFMDYRNNDKNINENTIIYGHNSHKGIMFGTLVNTLKESWYTNKNNQIITFNTTNYLMEWQIFSIYSIPTTDDYLTTSFESEKDFQEFISLISSRSIYDFNVSVSPLDKILTLSTCVNGVKGRAVIHAKLISQKAID